MNSDAEYKKLKFYVVLLITFIIFNSAGAVFGQQPNLPARGQAAIDRLAGRLPVVAARHGKSAPELRRLLLEDSTLWVDAQDGLFYVDDGIEENLLTTDYEPSVASLAPYPYSQTFQLNSRPGSNRVIYLDFDGHVTSGTAWNDNYTGGQPINSAPFSLDSDPTTFTAAEMDAIQYVWQRVAEDFAAFDVNVTTQDPGADAITRSSSSDLVFGTRVVISPTNFTGSNIGGIAYLGVFNRVGDYYKPAFVMTSGLGNNEKNIAEAASHEVGHNLNLSHDGTSTTSYYQGHGDWAPIMGVGYYKSVTQWSKGEYPGANNTQDDLAIMPNYGVSQLADDHGNSGAAATVLSGSNISATGIVSNRSDVDVFQFSTGAGSVTINVNPAPRGANLDILATLLDSQGNVVATSNPTGLAANFSLSLAAGTYFLSVDGTGAGDLTTGYSDYASIGQFTVSGTLVPTGGQPPAAAISATPTSGTAPLLVSFSAHDSTDPDGTIVGYFWSFGDGSTSTAASPAHTYNSAGTYTAVLTVTDNSGLSDSESVIITVAAPVNQPPVAVADATPTSGYGPLTVNFSSTGSYDPDGSITAYSWNFGNGATSTQANPSYTYNSVGTYTATLTVTDNSGAKSSGTVTITVTQNPDAVLFVQNIVMSLNRTSRGTSATAVVTIYDGAGNPRPNAQVSGSWSGLTKGNVSGTTNASGQVTFTSATTKKRGTFTFTVTNVTASGYTYDSSRNVKTSASITY